MPTIEIYWRYIVYSITPNNEIIYYNKLTYLVIKYYTVFICRFPLISDHHTSYLQVCRELLKETINKDWNYKFIGNLCEECPKCGLLLVDQDFVKSDFINKKKQLPLSLLPTSNSLMIPKFQIAYQKLTERQHDGLFLISKK